MNRKSTRPNKGLPLVLTLALVAAGLLQGCAFSSQVASVDTVNLPMLKNSADECYYLDEFMPIPDNLVTGKNGSLSLRYYTYKAANYKEWAIQEIMLSFYSRDNRCWSLFEEYFVAK